jgi:hypothetical protein
VLKTSINLGQQRSGKSDRRKFSTRSMHIYEIRPRADKHGFDLSSDALRDSPLWYRGSNPIVDAVGYARSYSRRHPAVIRVYDPTGNVIETLEYGRVHNFVTLIVQLRRTFDKRTQLIPESLEKCSRWFEKVGTCLIAGIVADLPRFSAGINSQCFSHDRCFGKVHHRHRHDSFRASAASA